MPPIMMRAAADELKLKPGFREFPEGFQIYEWEIGRTGWKEGFITKFEPTMIEDLRMKAFDLPAFVAGQMTAKPPSNDG